MKIERIKGDARILYLFSARLNLEATQLVVLPDGAAIATRSAANAAWQEVTYIYVDNRSPTGFRAFDYVGPSREESKRRDYELVIPDDVWAEALAGIEIVKGSHTAMPPRS
jgi:hypothetical protein